MSRRRVVLVDDHDLFRAGVRSELGKAVDIVGEAASVTEAVPLIRSCRAIFQRAMPTSIRP